MTTKLIKVTDTTLRDAHQSLFATRFNNSTISKLAPVLDKVGYDVLEVWGGATFDSCIRYLNEDPWDRLKMIKRLAPNTNLSMLIRGANLVGYRHYSEEIINELDNSKKLFKKYNWPIIDVTRKSVEETAASIIKIFDILNSK